MVQGVGLFDVGGALADDDAKLDFPIGLLRATRDDNGVVRARQAGDGLGEDHGLRRDGQVGLGGVVGEVQADGDELAHALDRHAVARLALDQGEGFGIDGLERSKAFAPQLVRGDVGDHARQVADATLGVQSAGLF
ncbi:hypothetical protein D3C80_1344780 [compost metagenome]